MFFAEVPLTFYENNKNDTSGSPTEFSISDTKGEDYGN
jgi:hypothetical protein